MFEFLYRMFPMLVDAEMLRTEFALISLYVIDLVLISLTSTSYFTLMSYDYSDNIVISQFR